MEWTVEFSAKAGKQITKLPANINDRLAILVKELIAEGQYSLNGRTIAS